MSHRLYLASMKRSGAVETISTRNARNGKKGGRGNKKGKSTGRDTAIAFSDTPDTQHEGARKALRQGQVCR